MGHQSTLTGIIHFKKSRLPCIWSFLFGIVLWFLIGRRSSGLNKDNLEVYSIMTWLYYGLDVDYASHLREEFGTSISHTNLTNCFSSVRFWSLILQELYSKEHILVPSDVETIEFWQWLLQWFLSMILVFFQMLLAFWMRCLIFWIPQILYWCNTLPRLIHLIQLGFFHKKGEEGTSKASKAPKKKKQVEKPPIVEEEVVKKAIPSKSRFLKRTKKPSKKPYHSPIKRTCSQKSWA